MTDGTERSPYLEQLLATPDYDVFDNTRLIVTVIGLIAAVATIVQPSAALSSAPGEIWLAIIWVTLLATGIGLGLAYQSWKRSFRRRVGQEYTGNDELANRLIAQRERWDVTADRSRSQRTVYALVASLLSPLAVLALSSELLLPSLRWINPEFMRQGLIVIEFAIVALALATIYGLWFGHHFHSTWVPSRLKAEIFRREVFLYRARVGPYLDCEDLDAAIDARCSRISDATDLVTLTHLLGLQELPGDTDKPAASRAKSDGRQYWLDRLEHSLHNRTRHDPAIDSNNLPEPDILDNYLEERLRDQMEGYYLYKSKLHKRLDLYYDGMSRLALWFALSLAIMHFKVNPSSAVFEAAIGISALVMPPIGACFIALRALFEPHRLSISYADEANQLHRLEQQFLCLDPHDPHYADNIKRLILHTETLLSHEIRRWWHIVGVELPHGG